MRSLIKPFSYLVSTATAVASSLILYISAADCPAEKKFDFSEDTGEKLFLVALAAAFGLNMFSETLHHLLDFVEEKSPPNERTALLSLPEEAPVRTMEEATEEPADQTLQKSCSMTVIKKAVATAVVTTLLGAAIDGLFTQSKSLMVSFQISGDSRQNLSAIPFTIFLGVRLVLVPGVHLLRNILGGVTEYTARVTGSDAKNMCLNTKSKQVIGFLVLSVIHLMEGFLLSKEIKEGWVQILSATGLAISNAASHLDHARALPSAWQKWLSRSGRTKLLTTFTGLFSGISHASPALLATLYFWKDTGIAVKILMVVADATEVTTATLEHQQHGARHLEDCCRRYCNP